MRIENLAQLKAGYLPVAQAVRERQITTAPHFDVFKVLSLQYDEAKFHTPLLRHFLDPKQTHSQGAAFYRNFIKMVLPVDDQELFQDISTAHLQVKAELGTTNFGRLDIFIHHTYPSNQFAIIIENKILANDQDNQIHRYVRYAREALEIPLERLRVLYLTPILRYPSERSINAEQQQVLKNSNALISISYVDHIVPFLMNAQQEIKAPVVKETLHQYINTIKQICNEQT